MTCRILILEYPNFCVAMVLRRS